MASIHKKSPPMDHSVSGLFCFRRKDRFDMAHDYLIFSNISFNYNTMTTPLLTGINVHFNKGWTGIIGANGTGKTTLLRLASGLLTPLEGKVTGSENAVYCRQRTDDPPLLLNDFMNSSDNTACRVKGQLGIGPDWHERWDTLSHGERKRAQIAAAIWKNPRILAVDEPTNHLDSEAREYLHRVLHSFDGIGLLVSHDREFMDSMCHQCLFLDPPDAVLRAGNYTQALNRKISEEDTLKKLNTEKKQSFMKIKKEMSKRRNVAGQSHLMRSKRGLDIKDHDSRFKKNLARNTNKDGTGGKLLNQLGGRLKQAKEELDRLKVKKEYDLGIWVRGEFSKRNYLFSIDAGIIDLGGKGSLEFPDLVMYPDDRIAVTGLNGSGKSTLISGIVNSLNQDEDRLTYIPQEIDGKSSQKIIEMIKKIPGDKLGKIMAVVSHLGSRPERLLESLEPSPGEIRKIMLAAGIANEPHLIIMDEPTNHMDLPSIECLEKALSDCPCGLLLVSHDRRFLDMLTNRNWSISPKISFKNKFILREL